MKRIPTKTAISVFLMLCLAAAAGAAGISVTASVDRNRITIEDQVTLTISVSGSRKVSSPELPDLPDFDVVSRGSSSRVQIINGSMSSQVDYQFILMPRKAGLLTIGPAAVRHKGKTYRTEPITIRVDQAAAVQEGRPRDLFITTEVDKTSPYVGEQVLYRFKFYRQVDVSNASLGEFKFDGFQEEDLGKEATYSVVRNGIRYEVTEIRKLLYPLRSGEITIPGAALKCQVPVERPRRGNPFFGDDLFGFGMTPTKTRILHSDPIRMEVRSLPEAGKPENFTGLVGAFSLSAGLGKKEIEQGESVTLTMKITGEGDLSGAPRPEISGVEQFKTYDDQPTLSRKVRGDRVISQKVFKTALVPLRPGRREIPEISLWYLDPSTGAYRKASAGPFALNVLPSTAKEQVQVVGPGQPPVAKRSVKVVGRDILPIATDLHEFGDRTFSPFGPIPLAALFLPPFVFVGLAAYKRERDKLTADAGYARRKAAPAQAKKGLRQARALAKGPDPKAFYAQLARTLKSYLGAKTNLSGEAKTPAELREALSASLREQALVDEIHALLQDLEFRQYAPAREGSDESGALLKQVETVITKVEKAL